MFIQINDSAGNPIKGVTVVLAALGRKNPDGSAEAEDKLTRDAGNIAFTWYPRSKDNPGGKYELRVNTVEPLAAYGSEVRTVTEQQLENAQQVFALAAADGSSAGPVPGLTTITCPGGGSKGIGTVGEWEAIARNIVATTLPPGAIMEPDEQHGGHDQPNLRKFEAELQKVHPWAELQHDSGGFLKPRFFAPVDKRDGQGPPDSPCGQYSRPIDFGDFGCMFFCNATSNDEWNATGRPPGSAW